MHNTCHLYPYKMFHVISAAWLNYLHSGWTAFDKNIQEKKLGANSSQTKKNRFTRNDFNFNREVKS